MTTRVKDSFFHKWLKTSIFLLLGLYPGIIFSAAQRPLVLSENAEISLLTVAPSNDEVYTLYGHTAIRIADSPNKIDHVFNYGVFDFSKPNFIYRFTKGETDYRLEAYNFQYFIAEYTLRGSKVYEQILNLTQSEKQKLWEALLINNRPENKVYRYNFFYDNCSTRPVALIEKIIKINYPESTNHYSFRDLINNCTRYHSWLTFGCDLALGSPTDQLISSHEELFLPELLRQSFEHATITTKEGNEKPLVGHSDILIPGTSDKEEPEILFFTPLIVCWSFFLCILLLTIFEIKRKKYFNYLDSILFFIAGLAGILMYFLCFISAHPCIWPNWSIIWLHPFHLIGCILFTLKRCRIAAIYYHFINFAALALMLLGWPFIPQHLNIAFIPLILSLLVRSSGNIYRYIWIKK